MDRGQDRPPIELDWFADEVSSREPQWRGLGIGASFHRGRPTDKPAAWVNLDRGPHHGQLTVWVSGEAELSFVHDGDHEPTDVHRERPLARALAGLRAALADLNHPGNQELGKQDSREEGQPWTS